MPQQTIDGITWNYTTYSEGVNTYASIGDGNNSGATTDGTGLSVPVTIPNTFTNAATLEVYSVRKIGDHAFKGCSQLTSVLFDQNSQLATIGINAFRESGLTSITIPASVTSIEDSVCQSCLYLTSILFEPNSQLETIGEYAFNYNFYFSGPSRSITIPATVTSIGFMAFNKCTTLTSVSFESGSALTTISNRAFRESGLSGSITIPASVASIENEAFYQCSSLTSVNFESGSMILANGNGGTIGTNAFQSSGIVTVNAWQDTINAMSWTIGPNTLYGTTFTVVDLTPPNLLPPICFPKGTPVLTNLGPVAIEKLNTDKHTIRGKEIVAITQSKPLQKHIVCFGKDSLSKNVPSQQTLCSMEHKVFYKGEMTKARNLVDLCENVTFIPYNGETLFNVLLKKHDKMMINNLICETLHPENIAAKISTMKDGQKKNKAIQELSKIIKENNVPEYQKLYASL